MEQREYWNSVSNKKEFSTPFQMDLFAKYVSKSGLIVDVGCGYGRTLCELHDFGYSNLLGFDFSEKMIERGRRQSPFLSLKVKTGDEIDCPDDSADAVILCAVLTCIADDSGQKKLLHEIRRVLKPNGILYINDFLLNTDSRNMERYNSGKRKFGKYGVFELPEGAVVRHHSEEWIKELLRDYATLEYERIVFTTMNGHASNGFYYIGKKAAEIGGQSNMDVIWTRLYEAAKAVQNPREISERISAGGVAAAVESVSGKIYTGVCVDTSCALGICAERNAMFHMITNGEQEIKRVLAVMPDGRTGAPHGNQFSGIRSMR